MWAQRIARSLVSSTVENGRNTHAAGGAHGTDQLMRGRYCGERQRLPFHKFLELVRQSQTASEPERPRSRVSTGPVSAPPSNS